MLTDIETFFNDTFSKSEALTEKDIQSVRNRLHEAPYAMMTTIQRAQFRSALELIDSIRRFDEASGELVTTTNILTRRILWLTWVVLVPAVVQAVFAVLNYFKKP